MTTTAALTLYGSVARFAGPFLARVVMARRAARGKEDPERVRERFGEASRARPDGPLIWLHGASVGEAFSLLPLVDALRVERPELGLLVTTGTRTSAELMVERLPSGVAHQYAPVDTVAAVDAFLDHWRPSVMATVESEIWPTTLRQSRMRGVKTALLSARVSRKSADGWAYAPRSIAALLGGFDIILAQNAETEARLAALGAQSAALRVGGALKEAAEPLPAAADALAAARSALGDRPVWLAASTHLGEETAVIAAHAALAARFEGLVSVLAPRHPERGDAVAAEIAAAGIATTRRSRDEPPPTGGGVHLVDRLGELGVWYRVAQAAFVGGSFGDVGGHNPLEPARLGCPMLLGPNMANFADDRARLVGVGGAIETTAETLIEDVGALLSDPSARARTAASARAAAGDGRAVVATHLEALLQLLDEARV